MPLAVEIAVFAACCCVVLATLSVLAGTVYFKAKADATHETLGRIVGELSQLVQESRETIKHLDPAAGKIAQTAEHVEEITRTLRCWTARADRLVDAVGAVAEPPVLGMAKKARTISGFARGFMHGLWKSDHHADAS